jgi:uncharacterized protein involved in response to NO
MSLHFASSPGAKVPRRWTLVSGEAHRLMFFFGALQIVAAMAWWLAWLTGAYVSRHAPLPATVAPQWAHAWLLLYGAFPFFIFGFLMTAVPNWLGAGKMPRTAYVPSACTMAAGLVLVYAGLGVDRALVALGVSAHFAGWLWGYGSLVRMLAKHWNANARYAIVIFAFLGLGLAGDAVFAWSVAAGSFGYVPLALHGAVWFFLMPVFLGVSTRMVPFFSGRILGSDVDYKPTWARPALIVGTIAHGVLAANALDAWLWAVDLPLAGIVLHLATRWGLGRSNGVRLLAVLHVSLAMLAAAFLLYGLLSLGVLAGVLPRVGLAPLHLAVIGYFAAMLLGMVSRVTLGHSGRALEADALTWMCYLGVLAAAVLRAAAELARATPLGTPLMLAAAAVWLAAFGVWVWRYAPMYLAPRADAPQPVRRG